MNYYYRFGDLPDKGRHEYYSEEEIKAMPVYPETPELLHELETDESSDLWPIHSAYGFSWEAVDCQSEDEARSYLGEALNVSVYEYIHDL